MIDRCDNKEAVLLPHDIDISNSLDCTKELLETLKKSMDKILFVPKEYIQ